MTARDKSQKVQGRGRKKRKGGGDSEALLSAVRTRNLRLHKCHSCQSATGRELVGKNPRAR